MKWFIRIACMVVLGLSFLNPVFCQESHPFVCQIVMDGHTPKLACVISDQPLEYSFPKGSKFFGFSTKIDATDCAISGNGEAWTKIDCSQGGANQGEK